MDGFWFSLELGLGFRTIWIFVGFQ